MTFHILGIILPFDFHIFQRGRSTTSQTRLVVSRLVVFDSKLQQTAQIARASGSGGSGTLCRQDGVFHPTG